MIFIERGSFHDIQSDLLKAAARTALEGSGVPDDDLTIAMVDERRIQTLNRDFLGHDAPTDVLAFPAQELDPQTSRRYLGDVIISPARAREQAAERGHAVEAELELLVVHGVLHLLGHDHAGKREKARMWKAQAEILERLGISPAIVYE